VREGERGDTFYFLETGECVATKKGENESPEIVFQYKSGDYFGELALLRNAPRAASIIA
jgi:cAMP-dependent protein kinase regulator